MSKANHQKAISEFGKNLNRLREKKNLSLRELSYSCDIDHSRIAKMEKGLINPTFTTILELAKGLDVQPKKFFELDLD
jgi:transcriptional regulator with XRE-family HTH domain